MVVAIIESETSVHVWEMFLRPKVVACVITYLFISIFVPRVSVLLRLRLMTLAGGATRRAVVSTAEAQNSNQGPSQPSHLSLEEVDGISVSFKFR